MPKVAADLGLYIDASGSIGGKDFNRIKDSVKNIVDEFEVRETATHVSAVWYSDDTKVVFHLKKLKKENITKKVFSNLLKIFMWLKGREKLTMHCDWLTLTRLVIKEVGNKDVLRYSYSIA